MVLGGARSDVHAVGAIRIVLSSPTVIKLSPRGVKQQPRTKPLVGKTRFEIGANEGLWGFVGEIRSRLVLLVMHLIVQTVIRAKIPYSRLTVTSARQKDAQTIGMFG